ncbi:MAG TPA: amidohydrolase family protein, partial [Armatimonadota bacterium]|nr:amidohydrolase family protein [Armatimonadota bacterium]
MQDEQSVLNALREELDQIWFIDTHEHLISEEQWLSMQDGLCDFSYLFMQYSLTDTVSAGCSHDDWLKIRNPETPLDEKWQLFEPYWEKTKYTAYCRSMRIAIQDLFELPDLNKDTYRELSARLAAARRPGWYREVLKDRARIEKAVLNTENGSPDPEYFAPVVHLDDFVMAGRLEDLVHCEKQSGVAIHSLDDLVEAMETAFSIGVASGAVGTKCAIAYARTLQFDNPTTAEAEKSFSQIFGHNFNAADSTESFSRDVKPLQDYMMHRLIRMTIDAGLPMQIHTGLQDGNGNYLEHSNPLHLNNIFVFYRNGRFDLFHAGYPFTRELGIMAKMFPGVYADLCW